MARWTVFGTDLSSGSVRVILALIVGSATIAYGGYLYSAQSSGLESPEPVDATIVSTSVTEVDGQATEYSPRATFNFSYEGNEYTSTNIYPGGISREFDDADAARAELDSYDAGERVTAYVPPESPSDAYLKQSSSNKPLLAIGAGLVIFLGGLFKLGYRRYKL